MVIAGHTHGAVAVPLRVTLFQGDVLQRTDIYTFATVDAFLGGAVLAIVGGGFVEAGVDEVALQPCKAAHNDFREALPVDQSGYVTCQRSVGVGNLFFSHLFRVELETGHPDVGFGHLQAKACRKLPAFFLQGLAEDLLGFTALVAAGAGEINVFGSRVELQLLHKVKHQSRWSP